MLFFINKSHDSKEGHPFHTFIKKHRESKLKDSHVSSNAYVFIRNPDEMKIYETNYRGSKIIWVPKVKT